MDYLPETDDDKRQTEEIKVGKSADTGGTARRGFFSGFLLGIVLAWVCVVVFMAGWVFAQRQRKLQETHRSQEDAGAAVLTDAETLYKLNEVQGLIEQYYLGKVDSEELSSYLFKGIAAGLEDPYASYYSAADLQSVIDSSRGEYFGIGATLTEDIQTKEISVLEVYDDSPASRSGLLPGDVLRGLDGVSLAGDGLSEVVASIKASDGPFTLLVYRPKADEEIELELECEEVELAYVQAKMLDDGIGYLRLSEFTQSAVVQFKDAAEALQEQGMEKLIVDLRSNPGGLLDSVCDILDEILPAGLIVYTEDRSGNRKEYTAGGKASITCEVAVLVNGDSASASEIFAGAIQDWELGPVVGTKTYGKGVVQNTYTLSDGSALKLTTETYYTPKGQNIDGNGIMPDYVVEEAPQAKSEAGGLPEAEESVDYQVEKDPVLEKAIEVLLHG